MGQASAGRAGRRWALRLAGSAVMLAVLFWLLPREAIWQAVRSVTLASFLAMLAGFLALHVVAATKWWWMMDRRVPWGQAVRAHFAGLTANLGLPGATGGDAVRAMLAHLHMRDGPRVAAAALVDRLIDSIALGILCFAGLALLGLGFAGGAAATGPGAGGHFHAALIAGPALAAAVALVLALPWLLPLPWRLIPKLPGRGLALRVAGALGEFGRRRGTLLGGLVLSLSIQIGLVLLSYLAVTTGPGAPGLAAWIFAWPLAKIIAILPVSLNGLGLREGTLAALLTPFGADAAQVVAAGLIWQAVLFAGELMGGLFYLTTPGIRKAVAE